MSGGTGYARFTRDGRGVLDLQGTLAPQGVNVINLPVWWDVSREWAEQQAERMGANLVWKETTP